MNVSFVHRGLKKFLPISSAALLVFVFLTAADSLHENAIYAGNAGLMLPSSSRHDLDTSFTGGVTETFNPVYAIEIQPDGKILVGGEFRRANGQSKSSIVRVNTDGTLDPTFNAGGRGLNAAPRVIKVLPDGKILAGGFFSEYNGINKNGFLRLNPDGTLDNTFNTGSGAFGVMDLEIQPDGKILIVGGFTVYNGVSRPRIARLNADGSIDQSFTPGTGANGLLWEVSVQTDGKIVFGGQMTSFAGIPRSGIARVNADGSLDSAFNPGTGLTYSDGNAGYVMGMDLQQDGKIVIGGSFGLYNGNVRDGIARINPDGSIDSAFNPPDNGFVREVQVLPNGKIYMSGGLSYPNSYIMKRYESDGTIDASYTLQYGFASDFAVGGDGKVIVGGGFTSATGALNLRNICRAAEDGTLDPTFNLLLEREGSVEAMVEQPNGKTLVAGQFRFASGVERSNIARFNRDGTLDTTFVPPYSDSYLNITALDLQADGKILVGGSINGFGSVFLPGRVSLNGIARLNPDGSHDTSFSSNTGTNVRSIKALPNGKVLVGGFFSGGVVRLNSDGSTDTTFNVGAGANNGIYDIESLSDGKIIVAGSFTTFNGNSRRNIARLNEDGTIDPTFQAGSASLWLGG